MGNTITEPEAEADEEIGETIVPKGDKVGIPITPGTDPAIPKPDLPIDVKAIGNITEPISVALGKPPGVDPFVLAYPAGIKQPATTPLSNETKPRKSKEKVAKWSLSSLPPARHQEKTTITHLFYLTGKILPLR